jgi:hypothetical protein
MIRTTLTLALVILAGCGCVTEPPPTGTALVEEFVTRFCAPAHDQESQAKCVDDVRTSLAAVALGVQLRDPAFRAQLKATGAPDYESQGVMWREYETADGFKLVLPVTLPAPAPGREVTRIGEPK